MTAEAYGQSPEFYEFLRRLEVFKKTLGPETRLILSTQSDLFRNQCLYQHRIPPQGIWRHDGYRGG